MPWQKPTLKELKSECETSLSARLLEGAPLRPNSVLSVIATMHAGGLDFLHRYLAYMFKQVFPTQAELEYLLEWGKVWGVYRKSASAAQGQVVVRGNQGTAIMDNSLALNSKGAQYRLAGVTLTGESALMDVEATTLGAVGNLPEGAILSLMSPIPGIENDLVVAGEGLSGGVDVESDEALRGRILKLIQSPPHGGNKADYETWALSVKGVSKALCVPTMNGIGTVGVAVWGEPEDPVLPQVILDKVKEYILTVCPVTAGPGLDVFTPEVAPVNFRLKVIPDTPQIRENVLTELRDLFAAEGMPGRVIPLTHLAEAISLAAGEFDHILSEPSANVEPGLDVLPILGEVDFEDETVA
ncbi:MAG: baseplate J/gp47 family protein [Deltaproteobacteria bacterium]|jgi:uncharacterized phage protein gp47/JayE|nr:baseplate J/gp47 family protein [Deltaproteobacteria bacterium]